MHGGKTTHDMHKLNITVSKIFEKVRERMEEKSPFHAHNAERIDGTLKTFFYHKHL